MITRRQMLTGATLAAAAGAASGVGRKMSALASVTVGPHTHRKGGDALVVVFLRGGADGLNIVAPYGEDHYYKLRPGLALARPNDRTSSAGARALDLNGFFGLHPSLKAIHPLYQSGKMAVVHAIGSGDKTRSHFEAMATMERGIASDTGAASGWLARHLAVTTEPGESPLRAVAISDTMPDSLRGATTATTLTSLAEYRLTVPEVKLEGKAARQNNQNRQNSQAKKPHVKIADLLKSTKATKDATDPTGAHRQTAVPEATNRTAAIMETLGNLYPAKSAKDAHQANRDVLHIAGSETLIALDAIRKLDPANYKPAPNVTYPKNELATGLQQAACMIKGHSGLEVAPLDMGGWDTHVAQGRDIGWQPLRLTDLGSALGAFAADLGPELEHTTIIVMTEFGRRAGENTGLGTDHGRASCMFLIGGGVIGGKVHGTWPGLAPHQLENADGGQGDLHVTTDYRDILAEVVSARLKNPYLAEVFPDFTPRFRHVLRPA